MIACMETQVWVNKHLSFSIPHFSSSCLILYIAKLNCVKGSQREALHSWRSIKQISTTHLICRNTFLKSVQCHHKEQNYFSIIGDKNKHLLVTVSICVCMMRCVKIIKTAFSVQNELFTEDDPPAGDWKWVQTDSNYPRVAEQLLLTVLHCKIWLCNWTHKNPPSALLKARLLAPKSRNCLSVGPVISRSWVQTRQSKRP